MRRILAGVLAIALLAFLAWRGIRPAPPPGVAPAADSTGAGVRSARLYFASPDGEGLVAENRELVETPSLHDRVAYLVSELDRGPKRRGVRTLPEGTSVLHVYLDEGGLMTLDLSTAFTRGFRGGTLSEYLAIASLVRTVADDVPGVRRVMLVSGGAPVATLGGHVPLDRPFEVSDLR